MEEQNKNVENQELEAKNNETAIQTKKPIPKKTIIIASIIAAVTIIATIVCIIAFGKSPEEKAIVGKWVDLDSEDSITFFENGTAELVYFGYMFDLEWSYIAENDCYRTSIDGRRIDFKIRNLESVTFITGWGHYIKESDVEAAKNSINVLRQNYVDRQIAGETMLPIGGELTVDGATISFGEAKLSQDQRYLRCNVSITATKNLSANDIEQLLLFYKQGRIDNDKYLTTDAYSYPNKSVCIYSENGLSAGETLCTEIELNDKEFKPTMLDEWGKFYGYSVFICNGIEYYVDWTQYTQESTNKNLLFDLVDDYYVVTGLGNYPSTDVVIPATYNGLPVKAISDNAFSSKAQITSVIIPDSVISIGERAFSNCSSLKSITISDGVTSIGDEAFCYCTALEEIHFNATAMNDLTYDADVFKNAGSSGAGIKVVIGKNVTKIPAHLFYDDYYGYRPKLKTVEFEEGSVCTSIGYGAFYQCINQNDVIIPDSVTDIGYNAFEHNYGH